MKLSQIQNLLRRQSGMLKEQSIVAIYLIGSQSELVRSSGIIPKGVEIDFLVVKDGLINYKTPPILPVVLKAIFSSVDNISVVFNGIWNADHFLENGYNIDIIGLMYSKINKVHASAKIYSLNTKILLWGEKIPQLQKKYVLNPRDIRYLVEEMETYVNREYCSRRDYYSRKAIYKSTIFIAGLLDTRTQKSSNNESKYKYISESLHIPDAVRDLVIKAKHEFENQSDALLLQTFNNLVILIKESHAY